MISYWYWVDKDLERWIQKIGYKPNILLDSGAYTAYNRGKDIYLYDYMEYIDDNEEYLGSHSHFMNLDVIGDPEESYFHYLVMCHEGYPPVPVYHYMSDQKYLDDLAEHNKLIALGNTVGTKDKRKIQQWINRLTAQYPEKDFHVLGSTSAKIMRGCPNLKSCDSSSWIMQAINGKPRHLKNKTDRAENNMKRIIADASKPKYEQLTLFGGRAV